MAEQLQYLPCAFPLALFTALFAAPPCSFQYFHQWLRQVKLGNYPSMVFWTDPLDEAAHFSARLDDFLRAFLGRFRAFHGFFSLPAFSRGRTVREIITIQGHGGHRSREPAAFTAFSAPIRFMCSATAFLTLFQSSGTGRRGRDGCRARHPALQGRGFACLRPAFDDFLATTVNAGSYICASTATHRLPPDVEPNKWHRTFWCLALCLLALGLICMGGLGVAARCSAISPAR